MDIIKRLIELEEEANVFGFRWSHIEQILAQIYSEYQEIIADTNNHISPEKLQEEIGDLLHAVFSLCLFCKFDPEKTLASAINKFERRLNAVKQIAREQGITSLEKYSFDELMRFWQRAKDMVG